MASMNRPTRPTSPWVWALLGALLGLLMALVVMAPARWLASGLQQASGARIQLHDARGSVWQGKAQLMLTGGAGSSDAVTLPGQVSWRLRPQWSGLSVELSADCCTPKALQLHLAVANWNQFTLGLDDAQSQWPASLLTGLGTPWNTAQPQGDMQISAQGLSAHLQQGQLKLQGTLQIDVLHLSSRLSTVSPMGSYRATLQGGDTPTLQLQTLEGSLQLSGQGKWTHQGLHFTGEARAQPERIEALSNLLNIIGRRDGARSIITLG
jgi:general secretion pathway protein N